ncbi:MAG: M23 family metallopeptidase [Acidimicrobiales bacterium]
MLRSHLRRTSALALLALGAFTASGCEPVVKPIVFPVDGPVSYTDTFGACRGTACERKHEGQDLMGSKMLPLLAAVDGVVHQVTFNNLVGNSVVLEAADGWTYHYLHVNNDTPGTDDAKATRDQAFPPNIVVGAKVVKGQVVGYLGDSGNAEATASHLHFEIREPAAPGTWTGVAINAYESLVQATHMADITVPAT